MTEVVTAFLLFVSVGVFLAHAFDAYRLRTSAPPLTDTIAPRVPPIF